MQPDHRRDLVRRLHYVPPRIVGRGEASTIVVKADPPSWSKGVNSSCRQGGSLPCRLTILDGVEAFALSAAYNMFTSQADQTGSRSIVCASAPGARATESTSSTSRSRKTCRTLSDAAPSTSRASPLRTASSILKSWLQCARRRDGARAPARSAHRSLRASGGRAAQRRARHPSWRYAEAFARRYQEVEVDPNRLFIDAGQIVTSGPGVAAIDMCLHLIRQEQGAAVAARTAREASLPAGRWGEQAQILLLQIRDQSSRLAEVTQWMLEHLRDDLSVETIAERAGMSTRTLRRRFFEQTRTTPKHWLAEMRVRRAQQILETSDASVEAIARDTGFRSSAAFRERFSALAGMSPSAYRTAGVSRRSDEPS